MAMLRGARGQAVRQLQQALARAGFDPGPIDGVFGPRTETALRSYQQARGLNVDGVAGTSTLGSLGLPTGLDAPVDVPAPRPSGGGSSAAPRAAAGGGGGTAPSSASAPAAPAAPAAAGEGEARDGIEETARQLYGYLSVFLDHPELGPILTQAASEGWSSERLQGAVFDTQWWATTSATARGFDAQEASDPATVEADIATRTEQVQEAAQRLGARLDSGLVREIARNSLRLGWTEDVITEAILRQASGFDTGQVTFSAEQLASMAGDYFVPLSQKAAEDWAVRIAAGEATEDGYVSYLREQARGLFRGSEAVSNALDQGLTLRQWADPYIQMAAQELETSPTEIDLAADKFRVGIHTIDQRTGMGAPMSLAEWRTYLRSQPEWRQTRGANELAAGAAEFFAKTMGAA